jgi:NADH-quinone oxidoreductase subunit C
MSIVEETRTALLALFPELAAAEAEARAAAQAEAEAKAAEEAAAVEKPENEIDALLAEMDSVQLDAKNEDQPTIADEDQSEPAEQRESAAEVEEKEPEEEGPRENGILLTDHAARGTDIDVLCDPDQVVAAARIMDEAGFFLEAITGVDWIKEDKLEVIYDYNQYGQEQCRVVVRAFVSRSEPQIPTIMDVMPSADWHERETHDFYGIRFTGHPNLIPILLPEDADFHPLLKDFTP